MGGQAHKRYTDKLKISGVTLPNPYSIDQGLWTEDVLTSWPTLEFGDLYSCLVDSKGMFTQESLRAYKSLEAYNYFFNGYVRTVFYYDGSCTGTSGYSSRFCMHSNS